MLSKDELANGIPFILKLRDAAGVPVQWVERLSGDAARHWYDIYRTSNWGALRAEAAGTFRTGVSEADAEATRRAGRCVVIKTLVVLSDAVTPP